MQEKIVEITSLSQFVCEIEKLALHSEMRSMPPKLLFRGHSKTGYDLIPSLGRCPSMYWLNSWITSEQYLVEDAQQRFPLDPSERQYPVILLAKLQHYGIPTRMLDLTENALVALHFASRTNDETDGEVLAFQGIVCSAYNPYANIIADTYRLTGNAIAKVENYLFRAMQMPYATRLLYPGWEKGLPDLSEDIKQRFEKPMFIQVGAVCERQKNQSGYFILFPNEIGDDNDVQDRLVRLCKDDECIIKRFIIKKEKKYEIEQMLPRFGITTEFLFADNTDEVMQGVIREQVKRYPEPNDTEEI